MAHYEFVCGSPVCDKRLVAASRDDLMTEVAVHVRVKHHIPQPTRSLVKFIQANTIREIPATEGGTR